MENNKTVHTSSGIGMGTLLTIIFVILKLVGVITWSWVWVLAPLWISAALVVLIFIVCIIAAAIASR